MLYTQQFIIPVSGSHRIGTIGGEPYQTGLNSVGEQVEYQVGYMVKPRVGLLKILPVDSTDRRIYDCSVIVSGYSDRPITTSKMPGNIYVELPCSVIVKGDPGVNIIIEAWHVDSVGNSRGASLSSLPANGILIPMWANSFDIPTNGTATFRNNAGGIVGEVGGPAVNFSIPTNANSVDMAGPGLQPIVFRQQG